MRTFWEVLARRAPLGLSLLLLAFFLAPATRTGWIGDDSLNSTLPGMWEYLRVTPLQDMGFEIRRWVAGTGRIHPLVHVWKNAWFFCVRDVLLHKTLILIMVGIDAWLLYLLLRSFSFSRGASALAGLLAGLFVQFRFYHDAVLAFNGLMQLITGLLLLSLLLLRRYATTGKVSCLVGSVVAYLAVCLTYECSVLLFPAHCVMLLFLKPWRAAAVASLPFLAIAAIHLGGSAILRHSTTNNLAGTTYSVNLDVPVVARTLNCQVLATIPGTYSLYDPQKLFVGSSLAKRCWSDLWIGALAFPLAWLLCRDLLARRPRNRIAFLVAVTGVFLFLLPAVPVAVCKNYQDQLVKGLGHLPVYLQGAGLSMLAVSVLSLIADRLALRPALGHLFAVTAALLVAGVAVLNYSGNRAAIRAFRVPYLLRPQLERLIQDGFLDRIPHDGTLLAEGLGWDLSVHGSSFYTMNAGKRLNMTWSTDPLPPDVATALRREEPAGSDRFARLHYSGIWTDAGSAILGQLRAVHAHSPPQTDMKPQRIAVRRVSLAGYPLERPFTLVATLADSADGKKITLRSSEMERTDLDKIWAVYELPTDCPTVRTESIRVVYGQPLEG